MTRNELEKTADDFETTLKINRLAPSKPDDGHLWIMGVVDESGCHFIVDIKAGERLVLVDMKLNVQLTINTFANTNIFSRSHI